MSNSPLMTALRPLVHTVYRLIFPSRIEGLENYTSLPPDQPLIITCNHIGHHDPILLIARINRNLHFLAKAELLDGPFGWFFRHLGLVRVNRDVTGSGLKEAEKYLRDRQIIAVFPEGTIKFKKTNELLPFKYGAVRLAQQTGAPILPVAIAGRPRPFYYRHCRIQVGPSYYINRTADIDRETHRLEQITLKLMRQAGVADARLLPGRPARNPGHEKPIV